MRGPGTGIKPQIVERLFMFAVLVIVVRPFII